jgi:hypothetical protein
MSHGDGNAGTSPLAPPAKAPLKVKTNRTAVVVVDLTIITWQICCACPETRFVVRGSVVDVSYR